VPIAAATPRSFPATPVLGDGDGVIVIPASWSTRFAEEAFEMTAFEDFVGEQVTRATASTALSPTSEQTLADFAAWRKNKGVRAWGRSQWRAPVSFITAARRAARRGGDDAPASGVRIQV